MSSKKKILIIGAGGTGVRGLLEERLKGSSLSVDDFIFVDPKGKDAEQLKEEIDLHKGTALFMRDSILDEPLNLKLTCNTEHFLPEKIETKKEKPKHPFEKFRAKGFKKK